MDMGERGGLLCIPTELLLVVFSHLDVRSIASLPITCRRMRDLFVEADLWFVVQRLEHAHALLDVSREFASGSGWRPSVCRSGRWPTSMPTLAWTITRGCGYSLCYIGTSK